MTNTTKSRSKLNPREYQAELETIKTQVRFIRSRLEELSRQQIDQDGPQDQQGKTYIGITGNIRNGLTAQCGRHENYGAPDESCYPDYGGEDKGLTGERHLITSPLQ
jgi:hypothetical protein